MGVPGRPRTTRGTTTRSWRTSSSTWTASGQLRKLLIHPGRTGFVYVLDRDDRRAAVGREVRADQLGDRLRPEDRQAERGSGEAHALRRRDRRTSARRRPARRTFIPSAFSPRTGLLYIPAHNTCMDYEGIEANYIAGTPYLGASVKMYPGPGGYQGELVAWDVGAARRRCGASRSRSAGLQRRARDRRRRRLLRHDGRLVQGASTRATAPSCGSSRPARGSSATRSPIVGPDGKQYVADLLRRRRLDGRRRVSRRSRPTTRTRRSASSAR